MTNIEQILNDYEKLTIKKLDENFIRNGYQYALVERTKSKFIFALYDLKFSKVFGYEVFKNKINWTAAGYQEKFPLDGEFGKSAWFYADYAHAKRKYERLP